MQLEIVTPDKQVFKGDVNGVKVPGTDGSFELLNNHAPIVSTLGKGEVRISLKDKKKQFFNIDGGILEMADNKVSILAEKVLDNQ